MQLNIVNNLVTLSRKVYKQCRHSLVFPMLHDVICAHNSLLQMAEWARENSKYETRPTTTNKSQPKSKRMHKFRNNLRFALNERGKTYKTVHTSFSLCLSFPFSLSSSLVFDFLRYLFCVLELGDKRWHDFIWILVCVSSSLVVRKLNLRNITRRQC